MAPACAQVSGRRPIRKNSQEDGSINIFSVCWNKVTWKTVAELMLMRIQKPLGKTERGEPRSQSVAGSVPGSVVEYRLPCPQRLAVQLAVLSFEEDGTPQRGQAEHFSQ